ncbi:MAG: UDP-glucose/GDP-mannose dehydrogenase family protein [Candidatus Moranbacteria bacterium]|nr:UDP-glucose/GDP-mannose dehydrogenase family protein [Candidatus Moranbacteria bacterium]
MKIAVIGTGYVGLVSGACFADFGHTVTCIDIDEKKITSLKEGKIPIYEPGLDELVKKNTSAGRLNFTTSYDPAISEADAVFIAVGTPSSRRGDGYADLTYVFEAAKNIAEHLKGYTVIVDKSTVPVGTANQVARIIKETNPEADFDVASNPEFLREGAAISDFMKPDRVVIGVASEKAEATMKKIYEPLYLSKTPIVITDLMSAELTKYAANAFLATKISFINEIANLCEAIGANIDDVSKGMGLDSRIGMKFLQAGPGYGGSCFPKDTKACMRTGQEYGAPLRIVETVVEVNSAQKAKMIRKIKKALGGSESGKTVAVLGLAFKPETDDMRDAPAITILSALSEKGARIKAHDPEAMEEAKKIMPDLEYVDDPYKACEGADVLVFMTEWNEYRALDLERVKSLLNAPVVVDLRNVYTVKAMKKEGFKYYSVGRVDAE